MQTLKLILSFFGRFFFFIGGAMLVAVIFLQGYVALQAHLFRTPETLLFVQGKYYSFIAIAGCGAGGYYAMCGWRTDDPYIPVGTFKLHYLLVIAAYLATGAVAAGDELFRYSRVTPDSIYVRDGFWREEQRFALEQIGSVRVSFVHDQKGRRSIDYLVALPGGRQLNLYYAKDFKPGIVAVETAFARHGVAIAGTPLSAFPDYRRPAGK